MFCKRDESALWSCEKWFQHGGIACDFCDRNPSCEGSDCTGEDSAPLADAVLAVVPDLAEVPDDGIPF